MKTVFNRKYRFSRGTILLFTLLYSLAFVAVVIIFVALAAMIIIPAIGPDGEYFPMQAFENGTRYITVEGVEYIEAGDGSPAWDYEPEQSGKGQIGHTDDGYLLYAYDCDARRNVMIIERRPVFYTVYRTFLFVRSGVEFTALKAENVVSVRAYSSTSDPMFYELIPKEAICADPEPIKRLLHAVYGPCASKQNETLGEFFIAFTNGDPGLEGFEVVYRVAYDGNGYYASDAEGVTAAIPRDLLEKIVGCQLP